MVWVWVVWLGFCSYSLQAGLRWSGFQATVWISDTSVGCMLKSVNHQSISVVITTGESVGSLTEMLSYDAGALSSFAGTNCRGSSGWSLTVSQANIGTIR
jgi:hypothetical protein